MAKISRKKIQLNTEKTILITLITSTEFCKQLVGFTNPDYFKTSATRTIATWIIDHYDSYGEAPGDSIQEIYNEKQETLESDEAELINDVLEHLSSLDDNQKQTNIPYLTKKAKRYFNKRALEITNGKLENALGKNNVKAAEKALFEHKQVLEGLSLEAIRSDGEGIVDSVLAEAYYGDQPSPLSLFKFSGRLGHFMGWFKRGWLVAFMGPMKRGKSYWLIELMLEAIKNKKKVLFVTMEMGVEEVLDRLFQNVVGGFIMKSEQILSPIFDCKKNQSDKCTMGIRTGEGRLTDDDGGLPDYDDIPSWEVCTMCRGKKDFRPVVWFEKERIKKAPYKRVKKHIEAFNKIYANFFRIIAYPSKTVSLTDIEALMHKLEYTEGFVCDVLCLDYDALLKCEIQSTNEREKVDYIWSNMKRIAAAWNILVATVTQSNRGSINKLIVEQADSSEDIRKIAHVVALYGLNQTDAEKENNVMRINIIAHRFRKFIQEKCATVLQSIERGQTHIDSEY